MPLAGDTSIAPSPTQPTSSYQSGCGLSDIVAHGQRSRWVTGDYLRRELAERAADLALRDDLDSLAGQALDEL